MKVWSFSHVQLFATLWTVALQAPLCMGFPRKEYCSGLSCPSPRDLPDPGIEPASPALQADSSPLQPPGKPVTFLKIYLFLSYTHKWDYAPLNLFHLTLKMWEIFHHLTHYHPHFLKWLDNPHTWIISTVSCCCFPAGWDGKECLQCRRPGFTDRRVWWATVYGVAESDTTEILTIVSRC